MDDDKLGDDHPAQYDLPGLVHGLHFRLGNFGRIFAPERVGGDDDPFLLFLRGGERIHADGLPGEGVGKKLGT